MTAYAVYLTFLCGLFGASAALLLLVALMQALRHRARRAAVYLGLTLLACVVAAGFYVARQMI